MREAVHSLAVAVAVLALCCVAETTSLRGAVVLTRHGDRTPLRTFANQLSVWPAGEGALTGLGMRQHYELGAYYRERYVELYGIVGETFSRHEVNVRSTGKERTLMSAQSFMLGFFPPGSGPQVEGEAALPHGLQPVPIYSAEPEEDELYYAHKSCGRIKSLRKEAQKASKRWQQLASDNADLMLLLEEHMGEPIDLAGIKSLWNLLLAEETHGQPSLPVFSDKELVERIHRVADEVVRHKFISQEMGRLGAGNLMGHIRDRLTHIANGVEDTPEFELISGHDGTILALFAAIGLQEFDIPDYAAHVAFELHQPEEGPPEVRFFYNGRELLFPGCSRIGCNLSEFVSSVDSVVVEDWDSQCSSGVVPVTAAQPSEHGGLEGEAETITF